MFDLFARFRVPILVVLMFAVPSLTIFMSRGKPGRGPVDRVLIGGVGSLQFTGVSGLGFFEELWRDYVDLRNLREENDRLRKQVARYEEERTRLIGVPSSGNEVRLALNRLCDKSTTNRSGFSSDSVLKSVAPERSSTTRVWSGARHSRTASTSAAETVGADISTNAIAASIMSQVCAPRRRTATGMSLTACFQFKGISVRQRFK